MDGTYPYKGQPLQAAMAKGLVVEVLRDASGAMQRVDIANEIQRRHLERGGLPARQAPADVIKRALWYLEDEALVVRAGANGCWRLTDEQATEERADPADAAETDVTSSEDAEDIADAIHEGIVLGVGFETVYLYFLPNDRELAQTRGRTIWECKIGRTTSATSRERILNPRCGFAHPPIIGLEIRCNNAAALERELHGHLREIEAEVSDSPGIEWFYTSPSRVQRWYEMRERQLEALKTEPLMT